MDVIGPYSLATAAESLHWLRCEIVLPRVAGLLHSRAVLAVVDRSYEPTEWQDDLVEIVRKHSRNQRYDPCFSLVDSLEQQGLWRRVGAHRTAPVTYRQSIADYVERLHSTASLARELMPDDEANAFDEEVVAVVQPHADLDGLLNLAMSATLTWGRPFGPS